MQSPPRMQSFPTLAVSNTTATADTTTLVSVTQPLVSFAIAVSHGVFSGSGVWHVD